MTQQNLEKLASLLIQSRQNAIQVQELPSELVPSSNREAYQINQMISSGLEWEALGWKIAGTTEFVQKKLNLGGPIYGRTFKRNKFQSPADLKLNTLMDPLLECEFFVTLGKDLRVREASWTMEEILDSIQSVHAGIEVAECRFPAASLPPLNAVLADGSAEGRYVFGGEITDWRKGLSDIEVTLFIDGKERRSGKGSDVMGDPIAPLLWLAEERRQAGEGLKAGAVISTGSMTGMLPIKEPCHTAALFGDFAKVEITFS